ncbi:MAG TPA: hypothetical protein VEL11_12105 [Candidatus Bathyarchaeia archaeon]|nr:hypothetical protein [Candidatus Bathyarchaeia archaeon]
MSFAPDLDSEDLNNTGKKLAKGTITLSDIKGNFTLTREYDCMGFVQFDYTIL